LVLHGEFMHPLQVGRLEGELQDGPSRSGRKVVSLRPNDAAQNTFSGGGRLSLSHATEYTQWQANTKYASRSSANQARLTFSQTTLLSSHLVLPYIEGLSRPPQDSQRRRRRGLRCHSELSFAWSWLACLASSPDCRLPSRPPRAKRRSISTETSGRSCRRIASPATLRTAPSGSA